ncbi:hypothetical protein RhiLY_13012 [Ceratobasidium sp. AG-Ba]|nr:hypothetical protein RhiLY_13012 [Ceratobasidium sp. AG-Ba]
MYIPELLHLVCSFALAHDLVALSQVCRQVFHVVAPLIWEHVDGLNNLLSLLPHAVIQHSRCSERFRLSRLVELPGSDDISLERFHIYASHVKFLEIYSENVQEFDPSGWTALSARSSIQPLLPNLESLTVQKYFTEPQGEDELEWMKIFIGPSLRSFWYRLERNDLHAMRMPKAAVMVLLDPLVERCVSLERLAIYPKAGSWTCFDLPAVFASRSFSYLQELSGSVALVASEVFPIIAALPRLVRFSVYAYDQFMPNLPDSLPLDAFRTLKHFTLATNNPHDALDFARFQALLSKVESLEFCCDFYAYGVGIWDGKELVLEILASWLANASGLKDLRVEFDPEDNGYDSIDLTDSLALERILQHRIECLYLNGVHFEPYDVFVTSQGDWSFLKQLQMPGYQSSFSTIPAFAYAPNLEHLAVSLSFTDTHLRSVTFKPNLSLRVIQCTGLSGGPFQHDEMDEIAWQVFGVLR